MVYLDVDPDPDEPADVIGDEPIWHDGSVVGWVTSGAYAHYSQRSLALGYVPDPHSMHIGIQRLPPAHALLLQRGRAEPAALYRYWQPPTRAAAACRTLKPFLPSSTLTRPQRSAMSRASFRIAQPSGCASAPCPRTSIGRLAALRIEANG